MSSGAHQLDKHPTNRSFYLNPLEQDPTTRLSVTLDSSYEITALKGGDFAIDEPCTRYAEDAIGGMIDPANGKPTARRSLVDPNQRDPNQEILRIFLESVGSSGSGTTELSYPRSRRPHYRKHQPVRSVVTPFCRSHSGNIVSPGPHIAYVGPSHYTPSSLRLHGSQSYRIAEGVVQRVAHDDYPLHRADLDSTYSARTKRALDTRNLFATTTNMVLTTWAAEHGVAQIVKTKPQQVDTGGMSALMSIYTSSIDQPSEELSRYPAKHSGIGERDERIAGWLNLAQIASMLEHGEPLFSRDEVEMFAGQLTLLKLTRRSQ